MLSNSATLSDSESIFVPILTYGHESWIMTERILTQAQAPKIVFLQRVHGVTKGRTEVRLRHKFGASIFEPKVFWSKCTTLKKKLATFLRIFGALQ